MHSHDLDKFAHDLAHAAHAMPRPQAQTGGAAPPALAPPDELAAQLRPHLTPEIVAFLSGPPAGAEGALFGGGAGGERKPFNLANFLKNLQAIYNIVGPIISIFTGVPLPPITLPVPAGGAPVGPPAGAQ
jgi:hypothetical protein